MTEEKLPESPTSSESSEFPYADLWESPSHSQQTQPSHSTVSPENSAQDGRSSNDRMSVSEIYGSANQQSFDAAAQEQVAKSAFADGRLAQSFQPDSPLTYTPAPPIPEDMDNVAAVGGAVSSLVLGIWSIVGSFVTSLSVINAVLGLILGAWGLSSNKHRIAGIGICLCLAGIVFSFGNFLGLSRGILYLFGR